MDDDDNLGAVNLSDLTAEAVEEAMDEFDAVGRDAFLDKYGFGPARVYFVERAFNFYDSKAITGAAFGYLPGRSALTAAEFSGGDKTVARVLRDLGFSVEVRVGPRGSGPGEVVSLFR